MRYFRGTLSRDGHTLGDVLGEIHLKKTYLDTMSEDQARQWAREGTPFVSEYIGSMETRSWTPGQDLLGSTVRLVAAEGFEMDVLIVRMQGTPWRLEEPVLLGFDSVDAPIVMPTAPSPVPAASRAPQGVSS